MAPVVTTIMEGVAVLRLAHPPVNALSARAGVPQAILAALLDADANPAVSAIVIAGEGRMFCGGADIAEFDLAPDLLMDNLQDLFEGIDRIAKPIVSAIHGQALGGGTELALATDYRVAAPDAKLGLPEVTLGIIPGAGGTQRLPRLVGIAAALPIVVHGKPVGAAEALKLGLIDRIGEADPLPAALALAREVGAAKRRLSERTVAADPGAAEAIRAAVAAKARFNPALTAAADCVEAAAHGSFADGLAVEKKHCRFLIHSAPSRGLRHAFLGERKVAHVPGLSGVAARDLKRIGIVGAGTMGTGIAAAMLDAGLSVTLVEPDEKARERAQGRLRAIFERQAEKAGRGADFVAARMAPLALASSLDALAEADTVIEAVYEDLAVKQDVFRKLDAIMGREAILASNTSTIDIDRIADATARPERVIGTHFFSPANVMRLLEIVRGARTAPDALASVMALSKRIRKVGVVAGSCDGFIGNRLFEEFLRQAYFLLDEGALPQQVDGAMERWGMAMGPLRTMDLAGQDIGWAIRKRRAVERPDEPYSRIPDLVCERGRFGQKTKAGFYLYPEGARGPVVDPEIDALVEAESARLGLTRRAITDEEIVERCLLAMINEGAKILAEGVAYRPIDIDIVELNGYGMNPARGGPMFQADLMGLDHVVKRLDHYANGYQGWALKPSAFLVDLARSGRSFASING